MPFIDLTKFLISYYQVSPDRAPEGQGMGGVNASSSSAVGTGVGAGTGRMAPLNKPAPNGKNCI